MKSKKPIKQSSKNKAWQQKVEKQIKVEKVLLNRSDGKERFDHAIKKALKKKS